jgi:single-strand DNA-binding protein
MGRLTKDPIITYTQGENSRPVAKYTLAVDRARANADGSRTADFISCVAFDRSAEFAERYLHKGTKVLISGEIRTGSYTNKNGDKVYTTDVYVDVHAFAETRQTAQQTAPQTQPNSYSSYGNQSGYGRAQSAGQPVPPQPDRQQEYGQQSFVGDGFMEIPDDPNSPMLPFN